MSSSILTIKKPASVQLDTGPYPNPARRLPLLVSCSQARKKNYNNLSNIKGVTQCGKKGDDLDQIYIRKEVEVTGAED